MPSYLTDYKGWIQDKADKIALANYKVDFYCLSSAAQSRVYAIATEAYKEALANRIDAIYEAIRDKKMEVSDDTRTE